MEERRQHPRARVLKTGRIAVSEKAPKIACTVRNFSSRGACLELSSGTFGIPSNFKLLMDAGAQTCRVVWRTQNRMGVRFEPNPAGAVPLAPPLA